MTRGGKEKMQDDPERKCIATGEVQPKSGLIRFVAAPDGMLAPDLLGKLPGRGFYVACERSALEKAVSKGLFSRAARTQVTVPPDLIDQIERGLARRLGDLIAMSRKAGGAVSGLEKVKDWLVKDKAVILIQASDGSEREKSRLRPPSGDDSYIGSLTAYELGLAFGRERVIHGALAAGGLNERVIDEAARLAGLRNVQPQASRRRDRREGNEDA